MVSGIGTALDAEVALLTPVRVPGVGHLPVLDALVNTPANELDSMPTFHGPCDMVVNAPSIVLKVRVDGEGSLHWATMHDGLLDGFLPLGSNHGSIEGVLVGVVVVVCSSGCIVALLRAMGRLLAWTAWFALGWVWI